MVLWYLYGCKGWGMTIELAAGRVEDPNTRVGLAATSWGMGVGLAASIGQLTGYIWIWLVQGCGCLGATVVCAWAESILTMPVGTYRLQIFLHSIPTENHISRFKRCSHCPNLAHRGHILPHHTPQQYTVWFEPQQFWYTTLDNPLNTLTFICECQYHFA